MKYKLQGEVLEVGKTQEFKNDFRKRVLLIETTDNPKYPNPIPVEFVKDKCEALDSVHVGQELEVEFFLSGNRGKDSYADRVFPSLRGFNFSFVDSGVTPAVSDGVVKAAEDAENSAENAENTDPLPF